MQPEDIDKLFRDRLEGHAPTPPDYLWSQLQQEIQPAKKWPAMWLYAAAAAVALLLLAGGAWLLLPPGSTANGTLATTQPARTTTPAEQTIPTPEKSINSQATAPAELASTPSNAPDKEAALPVPGAPAQSAPVVIARVEHRVAQRATSRQAVQQQALSETSPAPAAVAVSTPRRARPERLATVETSETAVPAQRPQTLATAPVAASTGPIVVEVRREAPAALAAETPTDQPRRSRLGAVLRQARNVVNGNPVDLSKVGLPEALTVQARVGSRTLTKTIEL